MYLSFVSSKLDAKEILQTRMTQTELRQAGTSHHLAARQVGPVKHRPEQHNFDDFCEPDDDD